MVSGTHSQPLCDICWSCHLGHTHKTWNHRVKIKLKRMRRCHAHQPNYLWWERYSKAATCRSMDFMYRTIIIDKPLSSSSWAGEREEVGCNIRWVLPDSCSLLSPTMPPKTITKEMLLPIEPNRIQGTAGKGHQEASPLMGRWTKTPQEMPTTSLTDDNCQDSPQGLGKGK